MDKKQQKLSNQFRQTFNSLARPANPQGEEGRAVLQKILPGLQQVQDQDARLDFNDQWKLMSTWTGAQAPDPSDRAGMQAWMTQQGQALEALKDDPKNAGVYHLRRRQLEELWSAAKSVWEGTERRTGKSSSGDSMRGMTGSERKAMPSGGGKSSDSGGSGGGSSERKAGGYTPK